MSELSPRTFSTRDRLRFAGRALTVLGAAGMEVGVLDAVNTVKVQQDIVDQVNEFAPPLSEDQLEQGEIDRENFVRDSYRYYLSYPGEDSIPITDPEGFFNGAFTQEYSAGRSNVIEDQYERSGVTMVRLGADFIATCTGLIGVFGGAVLMLRSRRAESAEWFENATIPSSNS